MNQVVVSTRRVGKVRVGLAVSALLSLAFGPDPGRVHEAARIEQAGCHRQDGDHDEIADLTHLMSPWLKAAEA